MLPNGFPVLMVLKLGYGHRILGSAVQVAAVRCPPLWLPELSLPPSTPQSKALPRDAVPACERIQHYALSACGLPEGHHF